MVDCDKCGRTVDFLVYTKKYKEILVGDQESAGTARNYFDWVEEMRCMSCFKLEMVLTEND